HRAADGYHCRVEHQFSGRAEELQAPIVVAAHGSWEAGTLPTQISRPAPAPADLLGFKAHFTGSDLPPGLMPLLAFPGGYGGMVHTDGGRVSLSLCIRRDCLARLRSDYLLEDRTSNIEDRVQRPRQEYHPQPSRLDPRPSILDPRPSFPTAGDTVLQYIMDL